MGAWTGLMWLGIGPGGGHLHTRQWTFGFHKLRGISGLAGPVRYLRRTPLHAVTKLVSP
jgi:hypothetical protein